MDKDIAAKLKSSIQRHEALKLRSYPDTRGNITIGYGRNISANGISESEADILLNNDIMNATMYLYKFVPWAIDLDDVRKAVLIELTFNIGIDKVLQFRQTLDAIKERNYLLASQQLLNSEWAKEVGNRSQDMAHALELGVM